MSDEQCYDCGCCRCDGVCNILGKYISEVEECEVSEEEKWAHSVWNIHNEE